MLTIPFIRAYLDGGEAESIKMGQLLKDANLNDRDWYWFVWTLPSIKYRWDWISEQERDYVMKTIEHCMPKDTLVLRQTLTGMGLSIFPENIETARS